MSKGKVEEIKPVELSSCARVWCELETLKLRLRMKPAPKPIDVTKRQSSKRRPGPKYVENLPETTSSSEPEPTSQ